MPAVEIAARNRGPKPPTVIDSPAMADIPREDDAKRPDRRDRDGSARDAALDAARYAARDSEHGSTPIILSVDPDRPEPEIIRRAAAVLSAGGLVAFPTETVYGLGANALDPAAVARIFAAKGRPADDPLIVHVLDVGALGPLVTGVPDVARRLAEAFWPGPLTLVLPRSDIVPSAVTAGLDTLAVRAPSHPVARALIQAAGTPVAAPSANPFGRTSPTSAAHVVTDLGGRVDLVLDGGACPIGVESTVVDCTSDPPRVLRHGGVPIEALRSIVPMIAEVAGGGGADSVFDMDRDNDVDSVSDVERAGDMDRAGATDRDAATDRDGNMDRDGDTGASRAGPRRSPGTHARHYAPRARLVYLVGPSPGLREVIFAAAARLRDGGGTVGLLLADEDVAESVPEGVIFRAIGSLADPETAARWLFSAMRELDAAGTTIILARDFGGRGLGRAVRDRLSRAAEGRVVRVRADGIDAAVEAVVVALAGSNRG